MELTSAAAYWSWKLRGAASIICCALLLLAFRFSHPPFYLTKPFFYRFAVAPSYPSPHIDATIEARSQCNIFEGEWVFIKEQDALYQDSRCPFLSGQVACRRNGRPDSDYEKWEWVARDCNIPQFNGVDMLERLRGKRMIIVGDSINRNQWESLACLLYSSLPPAAAAAASVNADNGRYKVFRSEDYGCSVEFYWSPFLVELEVGKTGVRTLRLDRLSEASRQWEGADIMVFNTGHWWAHRGKFKAWDRVELNGSVVGEEMKAEAMLERGMETWRRWVERKVDGSRSRVFFRSISPEHKGEQLCSGQTQPLLINGSYPGPSFPAAMRGVVERKVGGMGNLVRYLNITRLSEYRRDGHPAEYTAKMRETSREDCSHWCLPGVPDTWNRLLYASLLQQTPTSSPPHVARSRCPSSSKRTSNDFYF